MLILFVKKYGNFACVACEQAVRVVEDNGLDAKIFIVDDPNLTLQTEALTELSFYELVTKTEEAGVPILVVDKDYENLTYNYEKFFGEDVLSKLKEIAYEKNHT